MAPRPRKPTTRPAARVIAAQSTQSKRLGESRARLICVAAFFTLSFVMLSARLIEVSLMGSGELPFKKLVTQPELLIKSEEDVDLTEVAEAAKIVRREIVDRHGMVLATSINTASLVANPTIIRHEKEVAAGLHKIFPRESQASLLDKLARKHATFVYVKRHLTPAQQEAVNNLGVPGLFFESDARRVYPYGALFSHALGYVDVDNAGLAGIEKFFDGQLTDPLKEAPLALSLDLRVQSIVRDELQRAVQQFNAIGGTGIVMDIGTGELIAMANLPEFDPNQLTKTSDDARFNRATLGAYEMGSTFKTFTIAAALENKVVSLNSGYDATHPLTISKFTISDAHPEGRWLSVPEIYAYSSNIGMAKMALDLGGKRQQKFLKSLGFFEPVSLEVPELARPMIPRDWRDLTTVTVSYGHGISVSPLQLVRAMGAVAGDGVLRPLTLVKNGNATKESDAAVLSPSTIADMRKLMRLVVRAGTGKGADAPGYAVGGKTGTAEKIAGGTYNAHAKVASFVSVFPVDAPKYAVLVMVDEPKGTKETFGYATGGWVAAPVVGRVVQRMAPLLGMKPAISPLDPLVDSMWAQHKARGEAVVAERAQRARQEAIHATSF
jgi:cell division protein FtsI (penicillin-binding protein 3)